MASVRSLGEAALVARIRARVGSVPGYVVLGIGDDAAALIPERGTVDIITTDALVEGVHFNRHWTPPEAIGHRALAVNLSDLAAMGARPRASLLSLMLPSEFDLADFDALVDGFTALARASGAFLAGGNLTRSPGPLVVDVTAIGAAHPRRVLRRTGAKAGHELYVTGSLGAAAAGLGLLASGRQRQELDDVDADCVRRYERPDARTRCGWIVGRTRSAAAAIDLSDGLADAARRLAESGGVGIVVDADAVPVHEGARRWASGTGADPLQLALTGGDDYELAFAVAPRLRRAFLAATGRCRGLTVTKVGRFTTEAGAFLEKAGQQLPLPGGFAHF